MMSAEHHGVGMTSQRARDRLAETLVKMGIKSGVILDAIRNTPRHLFIDEALSSRAYENTALPIGFNQTISQPYIVAKMTEALIKDRQLKNVLEIGTGCGYQSVIMAQFTKRLYTIERIDALLTRARERFQKLSFTNIRTKHADGNIGWEAQAPFDGIIVAAAPIGVPDALKEQLAMDGRLIIPVGKSGDQKLLLITRTEEGFEEEIIDSVSFVPMLGGIDTT
ncbi:MAG TPA: protein-L-isoaspartate(D-aspartate) O-methyltransferase [Thiotrichaceae bacterium]|jgi:protein-L-isoaspartate(D-aspartate) O-methyltransferase|nr:protein-L-isoaspartate(D-aspartate) O-methyltransferase [Thiotrichaceae bacterium]HIM08743.1 protein-L-isoaspartate(D-aspartate) O-methyltransferase [Gammaproteobacteria bacterium]